MWQRIFFTLISVMMSFASIAAETQTDYDTERDFSNLHFYEWQTQDDSIDPTFTAISTDKAKEWLAASLDTQLQSANAKSPADFRVRFYIRPIKKMVDNKPRLGIGMGGFNDRVGGGISFNFPIGGNDYDQPAQIVVDFVDIKTQRLIWRGSTTTNLSSTSAVLNQRQLQKAFNAIVKRFPPEP